MGVEIERVTRGDGLPGAARALDKLKDVIVGVLSGTGEHVNSDHGQTVAEIAWWNEFGTKRNPARPFLRPAIRENKLAISRLIKKLYKLVIENKIEPRRAEKLLALKVQTLIQKKITTLQSPPNAPMTVERKGSSSPLIDTGQLRQSISWDTVD